MAFDVFISYSSKDKTTADAACSTLEAAGIRCWIAPRDVRPGTEYGAAIIEAIGACRVLVLIFSANANASRQIHREIERAASKNVPIVPMRIEEIVPTQSMEYFLAEIHWLDAITPPLAQHLQQLTETVDAILKVGSADRPPSDARTVRQFPVFMAAAATGDVPRQKGLRGIFEILRPIRWALAGGLVAVVVLAAAALALWEYHNRSPAGSVSTSSAELLSSLAPVCRDPGSLWDYDTSIIFLQALPTDMTRTFYYCQGDLAGRVLFSGKRDKDRYDGTAFIVSKKCGSVPYPVTGQVFNDDNTVVITGSQPQVDQSTCKVSSTRDARLEFNYRSRN